MTGAQTRISEILTEACEIAEESQIAPSDVVSMLVNTIIGRTEAGENCTRKHLDEYDPEPPF